MNPDLVLNRYRHLIEALFSRRAYAVYLAILVLPGILFAINPGPWAKGLSSLSGPRAWSDWFWLYGLMLMTNVVHELAHAVACKRYGGKVSRIGVMVFYLQPLMYCDVSDSWRFPEAEDRMVVAFAGVFVQGILSALASVLWLASGWAVFLLFAFINLLVAVLNLFPLVKLDGYWILVHALNEPNLQHKGSLAVIQLVHDILTGTHAKGTGAVNWPLMWFGLGHILSSGIFWVMGLWGFEELLALAASRAISVATTFGVTLLLLVRFGRQTSEYLKATRL